MYTRHLVCEKDGGSPPQRRNDDPFEEEKSWKVLQLSKALREVLAPLQGQLYLAETNTPDQNFLCTCETFKGGVIHAAEAQPLRKRLQPS